MPNIILDMAMSLDGFIAGPNDEDHGLHNYFFSPSGRTREVIEESFKMTGAILMGRRSYEIGAAQDGFVDNPYQVPTFVLTHHVPQKPAKGAEAFVFVTDGIESVLEQAKAVTSDRDIVIGGGASIAQQVLSAGIVDEIQIHPIVNAMRTQFLTTRAAARHMVRSGSGVILHFGGWGPQTQPGLGGFKIALDASGRLSLVHMASGLLP